MIKNVLLFYYDKYIPDIFSDLLANKEYKIDFSDNYDYIIEKIKNKKFSVFILDVELINENGIDLLLNIYSYVVDIPIIILCNDEESEFKLGLIKYGAFDFIEKKNINTIVFNKTISYVIERYNFRNKINRDINNIRNILESSNDAIFIIDINKEIKYANTYAEVYVLSKKYIGSTYKYDYSLNEICQIIINENVYESTAKKIVWDDMDCILITLKNITDKIKFEKTVRDNEKLLRSIIESTNTGIALVDSETNKIVETNSVLENLLKINKDELHKKNIREFLCFDNNENFKITKYRNDVKESLCFDDNINLKDDDNFKIIKIDSFIKDNIDNLIPALISINYLKFNDKDYILFDITDLTEEKLKEKIIRKRISYENLIYKISSGLYNYDGIESVFEKMIKYIFERIELKHLVIYIKKDKSINLNSMLKESSSNYEDDYDEIFNIIMNYKSKYLYYGDEKTKIFYPVFYEKNIVGFLGLQSVDNNGFDEVDLNYFELLSKIISNGITRIIDIENLYNNYAMLSKLFNTIPGPIYYVDKNGTFMGCNDRFADLIIGLPMEKIIGLTVFDLDDFFSAETINMLYEQDQKLLKDSQDQSYQINYYCKDNISRDYIFYKSIFKNLQGENAGIIGMFFDISENEKIKKQLIQSEKLSAVGQLAAGVAHEFNNILAIIKSSIQLIVLKNNMNIISLDEGTLNEMKSIDENVKRAGNIAANLMMISKPVETNLEYCQIKDIIDEVLKIQKKQFDIERIKIETFYEDIPDLFIDRGQMHQVFLNLSINARHAIQEKGQGIINVEIKNERNFAKIIFKDTGMGIKKEIKDKIFMPFFSTKGAHAKDAANIKGTGLGLSITLSIIQFHKGTIDVDSVENKGTSFIIRLPVPDVKNKINTYDNNTSLSNRSFNNDFKIAVVDDEKDISNNLKNILELNGYQNIDAYFDINTFIKCIYNNYDLIISGFFIGNENGNEILQILDDFKINSRIIFITANIEEFEKKYAVNKKVIQVIQKPFDSINLIKIIDENSLNKN